LLRKKKKRQGRKEKGEVKPERVVIEAKRPEGTGGKGFGLKT